MKELHQAIKPSEKAKLAGLKSLAELSEISGESVQTLNNWFINKPMRFELILLGSVAEKYLQLKIQQTQRGF